MFFYFLLVFSTMVIFKEQFKVMIRIWQGWELKDLPTRRVVGGSFLILLTLCQIVFRCSGGV